MTPGLMDAALLVGAGVLAGVVGTAGGITSLVSYPALIATGLSPLHADMANLVAALACWPGSALASRRELSGSWAWLRVGLVVAAIGGSAGAVALLTTPVGAFTAVVPYLVLLGSLVVLIQPLLSRRLRRQGSLPGRRVIALPAVGAVSVYGGYFGAGSGVLLLAAALTLVDHRLPQANAVKNMLLGAGAMAAAGIFTLTAPVAWSAVIPLAAGLFAGSTLGPALARTLPGWLVRLASALVGIALAVELLQA